MTPRFTGIRRGANRFRTSTVAVTVERANSIAEIRT